MREGPAGLVLEGDAYPGGVPAPLLVYAWVQRPWDRISGGPPAATAVGARHGRRARGGLAAVVLVLHAARCLSLRPALQGGLAGSLILASIDHACRLINEISFDMVLSVAPTALTGRAVT